MVNIHDPISQSLLSRDSIVPRNSDSACEKRPGTPVTKDGFFRTWFAGSADLRLTPDTTVKWGIYWYTPTAMIMLLLLGAASAAAHHFFYSSLHNTPVGDEIHQRWTFWIGSSLGFLTKVMLSAVLGISRTQWVWFTLRKKWLTLGGIDALFGVSSDPTFFSNVNMLRQAKIATVMAIVMWMYPLAAILTPGSISVKTVPHIDTVSCSVRSIVFATEPNPTAKKLSDSGLAQNMRVYRMETWYGTGPPENMTASLPTQVTRALVWSAYTGIIAHPRDLAPDISLSVTTTLDKKCGANCTYTVGFVGPAITCAEFTSWGWGNITWDSPADFMRGTVYRASERIGTGSFMVGIHPPNQDPFTVLCQKSIARYTVRQVIQNRRSLEPAITKVVQSQLPALQSSPKYPDTTYLANENIFHVLLRTLSGNITTPTSVGSDVVLTTLLDDIRGNYSHLGSAIELMAQKMIVSLLSFAEIDTDGLIYILDVAAVQETTCTTTEQKVIYVYSAATLLFVYALAVTHALVMVVAGFFALGQNGVASSKSVSAIIRTTRNRTLDERIVGGSCLGGDPIPEELEKLELKFGALRADVGTSGRTARKRISSFALGVKGEIDPITRGDWVHEGT